MGKNFLDLMEERYTTKKYDASKKLSEEQLTSLKEILRRSPSSINSQPWKFTFVSNKAVKEALSKVSYHNEQKVLDCDSVIVFSRVDSIQSFETDINERLPAGAIGYYNQFIKNLPVESIQFWFEKQLYLSLGILLSACASMNIDSTPMEGIEPEKYDEILGLKDYKTILAVAIGYRDADDSNQPSIKPKSRIALDTVVTSI